jgi:hypothetical protein
MERDPCVAWLKAIARRLDNLEVLVCILIVVECVRGCNHC